MRKRTIPELKLPVSQTAEAVESLITTILGSKPEGIEKITSVNIEEAKATAEESRRQAREHQAKMGLLRNIAKIERGEPVDSIVPVLRKANSKLRGEYGGVYDGPIYF